jgi:exodeoxyribonuclease VIII
MALEGREFPPPELHWSDLKHIGRSPAHFRSNILEPREQSYVMRFGVHVHALVLGGDFAVWGGERRGNAWKDFEALNADKPIVTAKEHERALRVAESVAAHQDASRLLVGQREQELKWSRFGRLCGGRIDVLGDGFITDLKTTGNGEPSVFSRHALKMGYHAQVAWYRDGARALGHRVDECYLVEVETDAPFAVTVFRLTERALLEGDKYVRLLLERLDSCLGANEWPAYAQTILDLDVPEDANLTIDGEELVA